jgi:hypothetical protein
MCLQKVDYLKLNVSTTIIVTKRFTASMCIQYCKGSDIQYQYAVLGQYDCTCAILTDKNQTFENMILDSSRCGLSSSYSMIGREGNNGLLIESDIG